MEPPCKHWSKSLSDYFNSSHRLKNKSLRSDFEVTFFKSTHYLYFKNTIHHQSNLHRVTYIEQIQASACSSFLLLPRSTPEQRPAMCPVLLGSFWESLTAFPLQVMITPAITMSSEITVSSVCTDCGAHSYPVLGEHTSHVQSLSLLHFCHLNPALILTKGLRASPGKSLLQEPCSEHSHCSRAPQQLALETRAGMITTKPRRRLRHRSFLQAGSVCVRQSCYCWCCLGNIPGSVSLFMLRFFYQRLIKCSYNTCSPLIF